MVLEDQSDISCTSVIDVQLDTIARDFHYSAPDFPDAGASA